MKFVVAAAGALALIIPASAEAVLVYQRGPFEKYNAPIIVARDDGSHPRVVAHGYAPQVSATGRRLAYFTTEGRDALYEVGVDGKGRRLLSRRVRPALPPRGVAWSPDDRYIVTSDEDGGVRVVDRVRRETFTRNIDGFGSASFAPDGHRFAVQSLSTAESAIALASVDHGGFRDLHSGRAPVWGRPGIAFAREHRILLRRRIGEPARTLLREPFPALGPVDWSANGHRLLIFEIPLHSPSRAAVIGLESKKVTRIPVPVSSVTGISNDGHDVLAEQDGDVVLLRLDGTKRLLVPDATYATWTK
jgi:hypothetical protein